MYHEQNQEKQYYLQSMEIDSLQINPIWYTNHNAGYGAYDVTMIDCAFGNLYTRAGHYLDDNGSAINLSKMVEFYSYIVTFSNYNYTCS